MKIQNFDISYQINLNEYWMDCNPYVSCMMPKMKLFPRCLQSSTLLTNRQCDWLFFRPFLQLLVVPGNGFPAQNSHPSMPAICHDMNCADHEGGHYYDFIFNCIRYSNSYRLVKGQITLNSIRSSFRLGRHSADLSICLSLNRYFEANFSILCYFQVNVYTE